MATSLGTSLREFAEHHDEPRFRAVTRNVSLTGLVITAMTELGHFIAPSLFPQDVLASLVMTAAFAGTAAAAHFGAPRRVLGWCGIGLCAVLGWYISRTIFGSGGIASPHRDTIYVVLAGAFALLSFSALEFIACTVALMATFVITAASFGARSLLDFQLTFFYTASFVAVSVFGIVARTRLQRAELEAQRGLEELNATLEGKVAQQVERVQRAQVLGRFLPPELSERVLAGEGGPATLAHARREVTVLCAVPFGFLEGLNTLESEQVAPLVNGFVSAMARLAHDHGGVIERFVGPRITVLFGALDETPTAESARRAVAMADAMQRESHRLLSQWERLGHAGLRLRMAIGVAAGTAVVGTFGSERRVEYSALGDAMVRAYRIAHVAIPGEVRLDEIAAGRLGDAQPVRPAAPVELEPGRQAPTFVLTLPADDDPVELVAGDDAGVAPTATFATAAAYGETIQGPDSAPDRARLPALREGSLFDGRYYVGGLVGRGGMGAVYRARHASLNQVRALKVIASGRLATGPAIEQFRTEAEATQRIHHPNVVKLHDFGRSLEGHYYLALDFVDGESLGDLLVRGPLAEHTAVDIAVQILAALGAAHELRLVHRDVKPGNVLIDANGRARVTDFGLAQPLGQSIDPERPLIVGTPAYMSPEQCQGKLLDGRSDLYSFGVTLYEMLTGASPYVAQSSREMLLAVLEQAAVPLPSRAPHLSPALWGTIQWCLAKDPAERPASAAQVLRALMPLRRAG